MAEAGEGIHALLVPRPWELFSTVLTWAPLELVTAAGQGRSYWAGIHSRASQTLLKLLIKLSGF